MLKHIVNLWNAWTNFDDFFRAKAAQENGWFKDEIIPVRTIIKDKEGNEKPVTVCQFVLL